MGSILFLLLSNLGLYIKVKNLQAYVTDSLEPPKGLEEGIEAPDFDLVNLHGQIITLSQETNDLLLVFSSPTCPACQSFWPYLNEFHKQNPNITIWMISKGTLEVNKEMASSEGFDFPILMWDDEVSIEYKVPGTPYLYYLKDKKIVFSGFSDGLEYIKDVVNE